MVIRIIRNRGRIGKPFQLVRGSYQPHAAWKGLAGRKWKTELVISEHDTAAEAAEARRGFPPDAVTVAINTQRG